MTDSQKTDKQKVKYAGRKRQTEIYFGKFMRIFFAEKQWLMLIMSGLIAIVVAKVVGMNLFITMEGTLIGSFAISCVCLWNGVFNSIQVVCRERAIIKREHRSGLSILSYIGSHMLMQLIMCAFQATITIITLWVCGVQYPEKGLIVPFFVVELFVTLLLETFAADMLGLMVSCIVKNTTLAMTVMPFILIVQLVFAGVAFPLSGAAAKLSKFTVTQWGVTALCTGGDYNSLKSASVMVQLNKIASDHPSIKSAIELVTPNKIMEYFAQYGQNKAYVPTASNLLTSWGALLIHMAVYVVVGILFLEFIDKDKR